MPHSIEPGRGGIDAVTLSNASGSTTISLLGATLIDWTPADGEAVIWLSSEAVFREGKGIRGGIPICWPWFGAHTERADFPQHGFARSCMWDLAAVEESDDGSTCARFSLSMAPDELWPHASSLEFCVTLGETLRCELITRNLDQQPFLITQALHTYFNITDISNVSVSGLDGRRYLDKPDGFAEKHQEGAITFASEVDRVYLDTDDVCRIEDAGMGRNIIIDKVGSRSTVVWNPWVENAMKMADMPDDGYRTMVCVETTNAASDGVTLQPGESHSMLAEYRVI